VLCGFQAHSSLRVGIDQEQLAVGDPVSESRAAKRLFDREKKYDAALVLPQHAKRADEIQDCRNADNAENVGPTHRVSIRLSEHFKTRANEGAQTGGLVSSGTAARNANGLPPLTKKGRMKIASLLNVRIFIDCWRSAGSG
jgi:hypothetical protein